MNFVRISFKCSRSEMLSIPNKYLIKDASAETSLGSSLSKIQNTSEKSLKHGFFLDIIFFFKHPL